MIPLSASEYNTSMRYFSIYVSSMKWIIKIPEASMNNSLLKYLVK